MHTVIGVEFVWWKKLETNVTCFTILCLGKKKQNLQEGDHGVKYRYLLLININCLLGAIAMFGDYIVIKVSQLYAHSKFYQRFLKY